VENDSSGDAQVVLSLRSQAKFVEAGPQISKELFELEKASPFMAADMRDAKKRLAERSDPRMMTIGNTRARKDKWKASRQFRCQEYCLCDSPPKSAKALSQGVAL
jgi:hypothetical protein